MTLHPVTWMLSNRVPCKRYEVDDIHCSADVLTDTFTSETKHVVVYINMSELCLARELPGLHELDEAIDSTHVVKEFSQHVGAGFACIYCVVVYGLLFLASLLPR